MIKLSKQQKDKLRAETGPYSEVNIKIEDRLLDNFSSRQFVTVYANINPLTYEIAQQNIGSFGDRLQWLLMTAQFQWQADGYVVCNFNTQVNYQDITEISPVLMQAQQAKEQLTHDVIQLHYFTMDLLGIEYKEL